MKKGTYFLEKIAEVGDISLKIIKIGKVTEQRDLNSEVNNRKLKEKYELWILKINMGKTESCVSDQNL